MRCEAPAAERCGMTDGQGVNLTEAFRSAKKGTWATLTIPLSCLAHSAGVPNLVSSPLVLDSSGEFGVSFDDIRWVQDPTASSCPQ
jgi:hypothetical protein